MSAALQPGAGGSLGAQAVQSSCVTNPETLIHLLRSRLSERLAAGRMIRACDARVLKKRLSSRQVVAYRLSLIDRETGEQSHLELIGKRLSGHAGVKAAEEFRTMQMLWAAGFGADEQFKIPRPIDYLTDWNLILEERACGLRFSGYVGRNSAASLAYARMAGLWLAKLHTLGPTPVGVCDYRAELSALDLFVGELSARLLALAPQLHSLALAVRRRIESFRGVGTSMVHGDYHPENILVSSRSITVIDFDRFCFSDPARDVGSFIAHLRIRASISGKSVDAANREAAAFLKSYFSAIPLARGAALAQRIAPFVAHACLEALYYVACVMKVADSRTHAIYFRCARDSGVLPSKSLPLEKPRVLAAAGGA